MNKSDENEMLKVCPGRCQLRDGEGINAHSCCRWLSRETMAEILKKLNRI
jgi:hypothetical protein